MADFKNEVQNYFGIGLLPVATFTMGLGSPCQAGDKSEFLKILYKIKRSKGVKRAYLKFRKDDVLLKVIFAKDTQNDRTTI